MTTCKTCRHWDTNRNLWSPEGSWGECQKAYSLSGEPTDTSTLAYSRDLEGWGSKFITHADFGCNQFEAKGVDHE